MLSGVEYVRDICKKRKIAISTLEKECGFANGYLNPKKATKIPYDRAVIIAKYLNVDINNILGVKISNDAPLASKDEKDIAKKLNSTLDQLEFSDGLMFDGEALDNETKELLKISLENAIRTAKITAKMKYTPKKYRKDN